MKTTLVTILGTVPDETRAEYHHGVSDVQKYFWEFNILNTKRYSINAWQLLRVKF